MNRQTKPIKLWALRNRDTKIRSIGFSLFSRHQSLKKKSLWVVSECVIQKLGDRGEHNMSTGRCRQWECEWIDLSDHPRPGWVACSPPPSTDIKTSQQPRAHAYGPLSLHVPLVLLAVGWARRPWEGRPSRVQFVFAMVLQLCSERNYN